MQDEEWDDDDDLEGADYGKGEFDYLSCKSRNVKSRSELTLSLAR